MKVRYVIAALALLGCGGKKGTIELDIVSSPLANPLVGGATVQIIAGPHSSEATINHDSQGAPSFSISFDEKPPKTAYNLVLQVLDTSHNIIAYGETPLITLNAVNQGPFGLWLGKPGTVAAHSATLDMGAATQLAGCNVNGLGAVLAGGIGATTSGALGPVTTTYVYDVFTSNVIDTAALTVPRVGAVAIGATGKGVVFGGSSSSLAPFVGLATAEAFDPTSGGAGQWISFAPTGSPGATSFGSIANLSDGTGGLVTGGFDAAGHLTTSASIVSTGSTLTVTAAMALNGPRAHHASAAIGTSGSAVVFGGLADTDSMSAITELYQTNKFVNATAADLPNLWDATATPINGAVFVFGGTVGAGGAAASDAYLLTLDTMHVNTVVVNKLMPLGISARTRHTATRVGNDILLCGGVDEKGALVDNCDLISTSPTVTVAANLGGFRSRQNLVAIPLETGPVVLAGGDDGSKGATGMPFNYIDIYTPTMAEEAIINAENKAIIGTTTPDGGN